MVPQDSKQSEYTFKYFYLLPFQIFQRTRAQGKRNQNGVPFLVEALLPSHKGCEWLQVPVNLDLTPVIIFLEE